MRPPWSRGNATLALGGSGGGEVAGVVGGEEGGIEGTNGLVEDGLGVDVREGGDGWGLGLGGEEGGGEEEE